MTDHNEPILVGWLIAFIVLAALAAGDLLLERGEGSRLATLSQQPDRVLEPWIRDQWQKQGAIPARDPAVLPDHSDPAEEAVLSGP